MLGHFSCVQLFATLWPIAHQAPVSMGCPRQESWSGLRISCPGFDSREEFLLPCGFDPLEKEKSTHSSILAWRIPWTV